MTGPGYGRHTAGLVLLLGVVLIWVGSSFLVSNLFGEQEFNRPFFITYLNTSTFSLYLVGTCVSRLKSATHRRLARRKRSRSDDGDSAPQQEGIDTAAMAGASRRVNANHGVNAEHRMHARSRSDERLLLADSATEHKLTTRETVRLGVGFSVLWFAANVAQNASLAYTTVASSSILCSTSGLFTLAIGALAGVETFTTARLGAVVASTLGVYCVMVSGAEATSAHMPRAWVGDGLALLSAALYGCYTTLLKRRVGDESRLDAPLFFGAVGLANIVLLWPGLIILDATGLEPFILPRTGSVWAMVAVNALVGTFVSDYLWLQAMLMTSPLVVTLGLALTIPLSMAGDVLLKGVEVSLPYYVGALLVLAAFIGANL
ncbi:hypothetical protein LPJ58_004219 [Coemansia sp. RSA 1591]|nr:hypothetical protein LPJ58_004219 [Coemansia sp. RSA 1591]KAJ1785036.1 hypothetical protein LPJ67_004099 [Coemansia sp. RSA 1938]